MAIQVSGTQVIGNSRELTNIASVDATTAASITAAGVGGGFEPTTVTGTTPSLNVGTYNYFSGATLNADTTISFASVPTNARWTYSAAIAAKSSYYLADATYDNIKFSVSSEETSPQGFFFKPDGTELYVCGGAGTDVNQYTLSTAWNIETASFTRLKATPEDTDPTGIHFKPDGTEMYISGATGDEVNQYTLSTAWNISTASFTRLFSVSSQEISPRGLFFKPDGTEMYITGNTGDDVNQYTLSTAWNISTASFTRLFSVAPQDNSPHGIFFTPDGTGMFIAADGNNTVQGYTLSTAWNISTASSTSSLSITNEEIYLTDVTFNNNGSKMFIIGSQADTVFQYSTAQYASLTLPASISNTPTPTYVAGKRLTLEFATLNGGTAVDVIQASVV